ncbi:MAG: 16S rRNA (guanine(966)-N(2))-methyltransferase RsmD [Oscillospiraceae bacterium]|nr:16S rRNA (guanine(966)-N(2))-methyltransferase RsmD [Oscillospiraceae bacterium]
MRVITGTARGRRLKEPRGRDVRPTTDMVKESMFNIISNDVPGAKVLDLFSGTGQLGIEALSRGAESCTFVDMAQDSLRLTKENLAITGLEERARVVRSEALAFLKRGERFDLVLLDPPYDSDLLEKIINFSTAFDILNENGIMVCETRLDHDLPPKTEEFYEVRRYRYGKITLAVLRKKNEGTES